MIDIEKKVVALFKKGISVEDIAVQLDLSEEEVMDIVNGIEEKDSKKNEKTVEDKMESTAETQAVNKVIERTKAQALAIQKAKEAIGDYVYTLFENSGIPVDEMIDFADTAVNFFVNNYNNVEDLKAQLETAEEIIEKLYDVANFKSQMERIVKEYVLKCATEGTPVDTNFVKGLLMVAE